MRNVKVNLRHFSTVAVNELQLGTIDGVPESNSQKYPAINGGESFIGAFLRRKIVQARGLFEGNGLI